MPTRRRESPATGEVEPAIGEVRESCCWKERVLPLRRLESPAASEERESCCHGRGDSYQGGERTLLPEGESPLPLRRRECPAAWESEYCRKGVRVLPPRRQESRATREERESSRHGGERVLPPGRRESCHRGGDSCCRKEGVLPPGRRESPATWGVRVLTPGRTESPAAGVVEPAIREERESRCHREERVQLPWRKESSATGEEILAAGRRESTGGERESCHRGGDSCHRGGDSCHRGGDSCHRGGDSYYRKERVLPPGKRESPAAREERESCHRGGESPATMEESPATGEERESCHRGGERVLPPGRRLLLPEGESLAALERVLPPRRGESPATWEVRVLMPGRRESPATGEVEPAIGEEREFCCRKERVLPLRRLESPAAGEVRESCCHG